MTLLRIGTRGSALALWQANHVREALAKSCGVVSEIVVVKTSGDKTSAPVEQIGVIGVFTKELEDALLDEGAERSNSSSGAAHDNIGSPILREAERASFRGRLARHPAIMT